MIEHIKAFWHRYVGGGVMAVIIAAIVSTQVDTPVENSPIVKWANNTEIELVQNYVIHTEKYDILEKAGFRSDGASEPRATWTALGLYPLSGSTIEASLAHDGLYAAELLSRAECDLVFRERLFKAGVESNKAEVMYKAVSEAGGLVWAKHTPESVQAARSLVSITVK